MTKSTFGTLADDLGCFPFDPGAYPPGTDSRDSRIGIRSLVQLGSREGPYADSVSLPPMRSGARLALKLFRRERAISAFD